MHKPNPYRGLIGGLSAGELELPSEAVGLVNNPCSWLKRYLRRFTGMDPKCLQSYLSLYICLFRVKRDDERLPEIARAVRHLLPTGMRFRGST